MDKEEKETEDTSFVQLTKSSLRLTSIKGVGRVFVAKNACIRVVWITCIAVFFSLACFFTMEEYKEYSQFNTVMNLQEVKPGFASFPTVVMCNLKPYHRSSNLTNYTAESYQQEALRNLTEIGLGGLFSEHLFHTKSYLEFIGTKAAAEQGQRFENFVVYCHLFADRILECKEHLQVLHFINSHFFSCWRLHLSREFMEESFVTKLSMILHVNDNDVEVARVIPLSTGDWQNRGVVLQLQSGAEIPNLETRVNFLRPGLAHLITVQEGFRTRLDEPYGQCIAPYEMNLISVFSKRTVQYEEKTCLAACIQRFVSDRCGCLSSSAFAVSSEDELDLPFCMRPREEFTDRVAALNCTLKALRAGRLLCSDKCLPACTEHNFISTVTSADWPRVTHHLALYQSIIRDKKFANLYEEYEEIMWAHFKDDEAVDTIKKLKQVDKISNNFLKVEIYKPDNRVTLFSMQMKISISDFISSSASFLNMYSGITLIVCVEMLDYFLSLIFSCCLWCRKRMRANKSDKTVPVHNGDVTVHNGDVTYGIDHSRL